MTEMIEITCNDRLGKKVRVKCKYPPSNTLICMSTGHTRLGSVHEFSLTSKPYSPDDTIGDLKKLVAAQTGTRPDKIVLKKWYVQLGWCRYLNY